MSIPDSFRRRIGSRDLDEAIETERERVRSLRRAMIFSRVAALSALGLLVSALTFAIGFRTPTIVFGLIAIMIGGTVWSGASRSSLQEAEHSLAELIEAKSREMDAGALANGWELSDTRH